MNSAALALETGGGWMPPEAPPVRHLRLVPAYVEDPVVRNINEMSFAPEARAQYSQWLSTLAVEKTAQVEQIESEPMHTDLLQQIRAAKEGNPEAIDWLEMNIGKASGEAFFKDKFITSVPLERTADGGLMQFGQDTESIHRNAITLRPNRHPVLKGITSAEAGNDHYIRAALPAGELQDNYFVTVSIVPTKVPEKDLGSEGDGYFLDSMTFVAQATTEEASGKVNLESAFMAGVEPDVKDFDHRMEKRFDIAAITKVYDWLEQEAPTTAQGFLENGLMIPKALMPNGIVDFMRWVDMATDEIKGRDIERKVEDYLALKLESKRKEASIADVNKKVFDGLIAAADKLETPMQAVQMMWELVKNHGVQASLTNKKIDPRVFGQAAASSIGKARAAMQTGNLGQSLDFMRRAHDEAEVSGCGGGAGGSKKSEGSKEPPGGRLTKAQLMETYGSDNLGVRAFYCDDGHLNVRPEGETIPTCQEDGCTVAVKC
jgi:hypothetical protein